MNQIIGLVKGQKKSEYNFPRMKEENLKVRVQQEIRNYIITKGLTQGSSLPTEKVLSEMLGISRTVIREALNGLELIGLVETRHGVGRFIGKVDVGSIVKNLIYTIPATPESFKDLIEIRITLETTFILRDLEQFTSEDIRESRKNLKEQHEMIANECDEEQLIKAHAEFHNKLLQHSDNKLLTDLLDMFLQVQTRLYRKDQYITDNRSNYYKVHERLLDAIETKKQDTVKQCLMTHFDEPIEWVKNSNVKISI